MLFGECMHRRRAMRRTADESSSAGRTAAPQFALNCAQLALIQIDGVLLCVRVCYSADHMHSIEPVARNDQHIVCSTHMHSSSQAGAYSDYIFIADAYKMMFECMYFLLAIFACVPCKNKALLTGWAL